MGLHHLTRILLKKFQQTVKEDRAFSSNFGKRPLANIGKKMIDLTSKLGEINDIEHNKGSKIYPQNQVILDCIMSSIPLKHKCISIILIWVIVSHKYGSRSLKKVKKKIKIFFWSLFLISMKKR